MYFVCRQNNKWKGWIPLCGSHVYFLVLCQQWDKCEVKKKRKKEDAWGESVVEVVDA